MAVSAVGSLKGRCLTNVSSLPLPQTLHSDNPHIRKLGEQVTFTVRILDPFWNLPSQLFTPEDNNFWREHDGFEFILELVQSLEELRDIRDKSGFAWAGPGLWSYLLSPAVWTTPH